MAGLVSLEEFRQGLEYFLLTAEEYKDQIRSLSLQPFLNEFDSTGDDNGPIEDILESPLVTIDLEHLRMPHWLPGNTRKERGKEILDYETPEPSDLRRFCQGLYLALKSLPFTYLPVTEIVVRDVYVLLDVASRPVTVGIQPAETNLIEIALRQGVVRTIQNLPGAVSMRQALMPFQVQLRHRESPLPIRELKSSQIEKFVVVPGIAIQASRPQYKATTLAMMCRDCGHRKVMRVPAWKQGVMMPRTCDGQITTGGGRGGGGGGVPGGMSNDEKCSLDPFVIIDEECSYVDIQTIKLQELPDDVPTGDIPRHLMLNLSSGLVNKICAGMRILVCGVYSAFDKGGSGGSGSGAGGGGGATGGLEKSVRTGYLHVLGIELLTKESLNLMMKSSVIPRSLSLSTGGGFNTLEIEQFHRLASMPDIIDHIVASIAPSIYGIEDIKRAVACMLFGGSRKYLNDGSSLRGDIHLLLLGDPSTAKSQVLKFIERAAPISIYTSGKGSSAAGLTAALVRDQNGNYALEGGAMVLADGGIVCIDEFDKMRDDDRVAIHEAMEQQTISIAKAGINTVLTTQCAVIAAANPTFGCYDDTKDASDQHNFEATILSRFDCIFLVRDERNLEKDRTLASHIFQLYSGATGGGGGGGGHAGGSGGTGSGTGGGTGIGGGGSFNSIGTGPIPLETLRAYISYARSNCKPKLSLEAAKRLENFYVEVRDKARTDRKSIRAQIPITVRQLESLARLAESFAKMSLSSHATLAHVEEAIRIFRISTVATSQAGLSTHIINPEDSENIRSCEEALLQRLPIGGRAAKTTIVRDLRVRGFEPHIISGALSILIQKGTLQERGDATVKRVHLGR